MSAFHPLRTLSNKLRLDLCFWDYAGRPGPPWSGGLVIATVIFVRDRRKGLPQYSPATARHKAVFLMLIAGMLTGWIIYFAGWSLFGGYEKQVALAVQFVGLVFVVRLVAILERP